ncbi:MAG: hypothetical protein GXC72_10140 [Chitinophagaceae bacterium]|nr:hypothetical protein [Chitinophagaceae bacterium]
MRNINWKKRLLQAFWILAGIGTVVLMGAAMQQKNRKTCTDIRIDISGAEEHMFIDEKDILQLLNTGGKVIGTTVRTLNLRSMETGVERNPWVRNAEMYFDNQQVLQVHIEEREPIARVFTIQGESFYLDSAGMRLPLSDKISARVPMFTGFPSGKAILSKPDSMLLRDVVKLGKYIQSDSFLMAQVSQIDITPQATFEMIPLVGDHVVALGNADNLDRKFDRLYTFYKQAWLQKGVNYYEKLDVQFDNQVVAIRKGTAKARMDSLAASKIMEAVMMVPDIAAVEMPAGNTPLSKKDSVTQPVVKPEKVKEPVKENKTVKTITNNNNKRNTNPLSKKVDSKKGVGTATKEKETKQPKAVMGKRN